VNDGVQLIVPAVCAVFVVNVAPAVMAVPEAVREVSGSPAGSNAVTVNEIGDPSGPATELGALMKGGRQLSITVMLVVADPDKRFAAVNVAEYVPACEKLGAQLNVPDVLPAPVVNVAPAVMAVPVAVSEEIAWPSGSAAVTFTVRSEPSLVEAVAGAMTTGNRSTWFTVIAVDAEPESVFVAVNVAA